MVDNKISHLKFLIIAVLLVVIIYCSAIGQNVSYISSIKSDLYAPSYIELYTEGFALLETYTSEIKEYTPDGIISHKIHFQGKASALIRIEAHKYLISVTDQKKIILVDMNYDEQSDFLSEQDGIKQPIDLLYADGIIYILDAEQKSILKFNKNGIFFGEIKLENDSKQPLSNITGFDYSSNLHQFYLLDQVNSVIHIIDSDGNYLKRFGSFGVKHGEFTRGGEIKLSPSGHVLISDRYQGQISIYDYTGKYVGSITGKENGANPLSIPIGIDIDENGIVYVSSSMDPAIDIYHVNFEALGKKIVVTGQYFPDDLAELKPDEVQLIAYAQGENITDVITGFSFELFDDPGLNLLVENSKIVLPEITTDSVPDNVIVTGTWMPEINLSEEKTYFWRSRVQMTDTVSNWTAARSFTVVNLPGSFQLHQNYPNPFNPSTTISFTLPKKMEIKLEIFNIIGQRVKILENRIFDAGTQKVVWNGKDDSGNEVVSGVYFYRLNTEGFSENRKMVLIK